MAEAGLSLEPIEEAVQMLHRINATSESAQAALSEFLELHEGGAQFYEIGFKELSQPLPQGFPIFPIEGALMLLHELRTTHQLALVTRGKEQFQFEKLKKAGIDCSLFSKIVVLEAGNKGPHYQAVAEELGVSSSKVLVCGDRITLDLSPAKELGYRTIHMPWGRGRHLPGAKCDVDFTIVKLREIKQIIADLE